MRLWMIASLETFEALERRGRLRCDGRRATRGFRNGGAYRWMADRMRERLGPAPGGVRYPLWAWARWEGADRRKPDLRSCRHTVGPGRFVRLDIEAPASRVLLSDFDAWHAVLNGWYLSWSEAEDEAFHQPREGRSEASRRADIENSWTRIFDLEGGDPTWRGRPFERSIQATFWSLERADVVGVTLFDGVNT